MPNYHNRTIPKNKAKLLKTLGANAVAQCLKLLLPTAASRTGASVQI